MAGKGLPKTGGRTKGTPNKSTEALLEKCERLNIDPFEALLLIARDGDEEITRLNALKEACSYLFPKRKAIEHTGDFDVALAVKVKSLMDMPKDQIIKETEAELKRLSKSKPK